MHSFALWAHPWWVNLLVLVPAINFFYWRRHPLEITWRQLLYASMFAIGFGFVEAAVVVYLRAAIGLLPGYQLTLADVTRLSSDIYQQSRNVQEIPASLLAVEVVREAATMLMLFGVALLAAGRWRERWAFFLWSFAIWDIVYYGGLWATVRWPSSLTTLDVLFLIPVPWLSQVWYPILVSLLCVGAVIAGRTASTGRPVA
jgi:hypothetical protein